MAAELDLPETDAKEQPLIVEAVRKALRQLHGWLRIFDDANTPGEIQSFLPQGYRAYSHYLVKKWPPEVAVEFLLKRTGQRDEGAAVARRLRRSRDESRAQAEDWELNVKCIFS